MVRNKYDEIIKKFEMGYSHFFNKTVDWWPSGKFGITAKLNDGGLMEYNYLDNTIRFVDNDKSPEDSEWLKKEIGRNISKFMDGSGMSQGEIAEKCGITPAMLSRYIHGTSMPGVDKLYVIARVLGCRLSDLTGELSE